MNSTLTGQQVFIEFGLININNVDATIKNISTSLEKKNFNSVKDFWQVCNANIVSSPNHVLFAFFHSIQAINSKNAFSKNIQLEFLCRLTATRKIHLALKNAELKKGNQMICIIISSSNNKQVNEMKKIIEKELSFKSRDFELNFEFVKKFFKVTDTELNALNDYSKEAALQELVLEKIALNEFS